MAPTGALGRHYVLYELRAPERGRRTSLRKLRGGAGPGRRGRRPRGWRRDVWSLRAARRAGPWCHGAGVEGVGPPPQARGCHKGASVRPAPVAGGPRRDGPALRGGGRGRGQAQPPQHRHHLLRGRLRRQAGHRDGARGGSHALGPARGGTARAEHRRRRARPAARRGRLRALHGRGAPRHKAGQRVRPPTRTPWAWCTAT